MMTNKQITLYIGGTKQRQAGFADLAIIGLFPVGEFKNMDRVTLISEKPVWSIKHTSDYILYHLIDRRVKSFDADANGVLSIAMTIPNDMQLADGKSPYTLLKTVYDKFLNEYMTPYSDGRDSFLDKKVDSESFQQIVAQYSLEPRKGGYVVMNGTLTGTLCVPQNKMEDLFRDSQYAEFANLKDIEIGTSCNTTMGLEHLEIPRPISYEIWVNGIKQSVSLSEPSGGYTTRLNDTVDYKYQNISFTLGDVMASENGIFSQGASSVKLDKEKRRILCDVQKVEIRYKGTLKFIGKPGNKDVVKRAVENGEICIDLGNCNLMDYLMSDLEFEIPFRLLRNSSFSITPNKTKQGLILSVMPSIQQDQQSITLEVVIREEEKKPVVIPADKKDNYSTHTNKLTPKTTYPKEEDTYGEEERKRKETEKRKKTLINGFVAGFVSALVFCCLVFGAYCMFKGDEQKNQLQEELEKVNGEYNELSKKYNNLSIENEELKGEIHELQNAANAEAKAAAEITAVAEAKAAKAKAQAKDKAEILELVKNKKLNECRSHPGWNKLLTQNERLAVESILNLSQYKGAYKNRVEKYVSTLNISTWEDIMKARDEIITLMNSR